MEKRSERGRGVRGEIREFRPEDCRMLVVAELGDLHGQHGIVQWLAARQSHTELNHLGVQVDTQFHAILPKLCAAHWS